MILHSPKVNPNKNHLFVLESKQSKQFGCISTRARARSHLKKVWTFGQILSLRALKVHKGYQCTLQSKLRMF